MPLNNNATLVRRAFVFALFDFLWLLFRRRLPALRGRRAARAVLVLAAAAFACGPALSTTLLYGDDLLFHLNRIEGLAQEWMAGTGLPVYLQSRWFGGQGYPVSVFYCDAFLYLPALLRVIGFPLQTALQTYIMLVTVLTAAAAYWAFYHIFRSDWAGALGCVLYTLAPYRLFDVFGRSALGEYTALAFAPLILAGLWDVFVLDPADARCRRCWLPVALGYAGVVQSHLLSTVMFALFTFALCLLCLRRTLRPAALAALCKGAGGAGLLSLWYLVPLADCMRKGGFAVSESGWRDMQSAGTLPGQLLQILAGGGNRGRELAQGMTGDMPQGPGLALLLAVLLFALYLLLDAEAVSEAGMARARQAAAAGALGGGAALLLCLAGMPWNLLQKLPALGRVLGVVQFPWRYLGLACLLLTMLACALTGLVRPHARAAAPALAAVLALCCVLEAGHTLSTAVDGAAPVVCCDGQALDSYRCGDGEYLPAGVHIEDVYALPQQPQGEGVQLTGFARTGAACTFTAAAPQGGTVTVPLLACLYYRATAGDAVLPVARSAQGQLTVTLPAGFDGAVQVRFVPPWYWRAAAAVSALTAAAGLVWLARSACRSRKR